MQDQLLEILKYVFLALVYLFLLNVVLTVRKELRDPAVLAQAPSNRRNSRAPAAPVAKAGPATSSRKRGPSQGRLRLKGSPRAAPAVQITDQITIGRSPGCGFVIAGDSTVSSVHARLFRKTDGLWLEDLNSTNGTACNGTPVTRPIPVPLKSVIRCGDTEIELIP